MKQNMIKHFLNLNKNGGKLIKRQINEDEIVLCDGYFFFIQDREKMVLNEKLFTELDSDIFTKIIEDEGYVALGLEYKIKDSCFLPTHRKNKFNILIKNTEEDILDNRVIVNKEKLDLFDYSKIEVKGQTDVVKVYDIKGKLLGGVLPLRCSDYNI